MKLRQLNLGRVNYRAGLELQYQVKKSVLEARGTPESHSPSECLITCQHDPPVYTIGKRSSFYSKSEEMRLRKLGAQFFKTDRGGLITFHGPGQLVAYPIIDIKKRGITVKEYVNRLEQLVMRVCDRFGLHDTYLLNESKYTGVWLKGRTKGGGIEKGVQTQRKICALGVNVSDGVTTHGLALNVNTDLNWFSHVVPCGLEDCDVTSISQELNETSLVVADALPIFIEEFVKSFKVSQFTT